MEEYRFSWRNTITVVSEDGRVMDFTLPSRNLSHIYKWVASDKCEEGGYVERVIGNVRKRVSKCSFHTFTELDKQNIWAITEGRVITENMRINSLTSDQFIQIWDNWKFNTYKFDLLQGVTGMCNEKKHYFKLSYENNPRVRKILNDTVHRRGVTLTAHEKCYTEIYKII